MEPAREIVGPIKCEPCNYALNPEDVCCNPCFECDVDILCSCDRRKPECKFCGHSLFLCPQHITKHFKRCISCNSTICRTCASSAEDECPDPECQNSDLQWSERSSRVLGRAPPETHHALCPNCVESTYWRCHECGIIAPHGYDASCCSGRICHNCFKGAKICEFCGKKCCERSQNKHRIADCRKCRSEFIHDSLAPVCVINRCTSCIALNISHYKNCLFCPRSITRILVVRRCANCSYEHRARVCPDHISASVHSSITKWNSCSVCCDWICRKCRRADERRKPLICAFCINYIDTIYESMDNRLIFDLRPLVIGFITGNRLARLWK